MVNSIPADLFRRKENLYELDKCVICQEYFKKRSKVVELACGHIFHDECADPIDECSLCRTPLDATLWMMNGDYQEDYEEYLEQVEANAEEDPVELVREYEANNHVHAQHRKAKICSTGIKVGLIALGIFCLFFYVYMNKMTLSSNSGHSPYSCKGPDHNFGPPPGGYTDHL